MKEPRSSILIVDDDLRTRQLLEWYLKDQVFLAITTGDARRVSEILSPQPAKLLILDLMVAGEDGLTRCRRLRREGENIPILVLTAKGDEVNRIVSLEVDADDYLSNSLVRASWWLGSTPICGGNNLTRPPGAPSPESVSIRFGPCELNLGRRVVKNSGKSLTLTNGAVRRVGSARHACAQTVVGGQADGQRTARS